MKSRRRAEPHVLGFQIAPMVDVLLVLLCFFIVTWSFARKEMELDVKVPSAQNAKESNPVVNQIVLNVKADGTLVMNHKTYSDEELVKRMTELSGLYPDYAVILRGDKNVRYEHIASVLDLLRQSNIWNVAFATGKTE